MEEVVGRLLGCGLALLSSFTFAWSGLFLTLSSLPASQILLYRMTLSVVLLLPYLIHSTRNVTVPRRDVTVPRGDVTVPRGDVTVPRDDDIARTGPTSITGEGKDLMWLTFVGVCCAMEVLLHFYAMKLMPYADASAIIFSGFVITLFFAWIFLKESCGVFEILMTLVTIAGIVLVAHPEAIGAVINGTQHQNIFDNALQRLLGTLLAVLSCFFSAATFVSLRKITHIHFTITTFHISCWSTVVSAVVTGAFREWSLPENYREWLYVFAVALFGFFSIMFVCQALRLEEAGCVFMIRTSEIPFSYVLQIVFMDEYPNMYAAIGATIISTTSVSCGLRAWLRTRKIRDYDELDESEKKEYESERDYRVCC